MCFVLSSIVNLCVFLLSSAFLLSRVADTRELATKRRAV